MIEMIFYPPTVALSRLAVVMEAAAAAAAAVFWEARAAFPQSPNFEN